MLIVNIVFSYYDVIGKAIRSHRPWVEKMEHKKRNKLKKKQK